MPDKKVVIADRDGVGLARGKKGIIISSFQDKEDGKNAYYIQLENGKIEVFFDGEFEYEKNLI